jgi:hypothetical protein
VRLQTDPSHASFNVNVTVPGSCAAPFNVHHISLLDRSRYIRTMLPRIPVGTMLSALVTQIWDKQKSKDILLSCALQTRLPAGNTGVFRVCLHACALSSMPHSLVSQRALVVAPVAACVQGGEQGWAGRAIRNLTHCIDGRVWRGHEGVAAAYLCWALFPVLQFLCRCFDPVLVSFYCRTVCAVYCSCRRTILQGRLQSKCYV